MPLESIQSFQILIPSFFSSPFVALINERLESLICAPVPQSPLQSAVVENSCHLIPPPLVLIREQCSRSSGSSFSHCPLTTVRPDSTLIALTPHHLPVPSLHNLCCGETVGEVESRVTESLFSSC